MSEIEGATLLERLERRLTERERALLGCARAWCEERGAPLYLVGGSVRDLLLGRPHLDLDLAIDGEATALGAAVGRIFGGEVTSHDHFGTAVVSGEDWSLDIARTRSERYSYPGALPLVAPAPIEEDLARRDFTIQALALALTGSPAGLLLDPCGGRVDLDARSMRVLHGDSFRDDPTRVLRLARYAARLEFEIEPQTRTLARRDATFLSAVSPARITNELDRTCDEPLPERSFVLLRDLHALVPIYPHFELSATLDESFGRLRSDGGPRPGLTEYLSAVAALWPRPNAQGLADALELRQEERTALLDVPGATSALRSLTGGAADPATVVATLSSLRIAAIRGAGAAAGGAAASLVRRYLNEWRGVTAVLRGHEVIALGVPQGPAVGEVLALLRTGRLRGELQSAEDERTAVCAWLAQHGGMESNDTA